MPVNTKISEQDLTYSILYILLREHTAMSTSTLKQHLKDLLQPCGENLDSLLNRNDDKIDQIIRNVISHRNDSTNNIISRGLISYDNSMIALTSNGLDYLNQYFSGILQNSI